jgi:hypothetical protein
MEMLKMKRRVKQLNQRVKEVVRRANLHHLLLPPLMMTMMMMMMTMMRMRKTEMKTMKVLSLSFSEHLSQQIDISIRLIFTLWTKS